MPSLIFFPSFAMTAGALVDETDAQGNTALHLALLHPQPKSMDRLYQIVDDIVSKSNTIDAKVKKERSIIWNRSSQLYDRIRSVIQLFC